MALHTPAHEGSHTTVTDRPARAPITRNGVTRRLYENDPSFGQKMTTDGKVMLGSRPNAE